MIRISIGTLLLFLIAVDSHGQRLRDKIGLKPQNITVDGRERTYRVAVPPRINTPMPIVLVLHGGGFGNLGAVNIIGFTQFTRVALREKFIVAYPMGIEGNWNDGRGVPSIKAHNENIDDVKFIRMVIDEIAKSHPVDRTRVFCTGISNGAFMTHRLAAEASDLITAVATVAGGMGEDLSKRFKPDHPVSLMVIKGDADLQVPFNGGEVGSRAAQTRGRNIPTKETVKKYLDRNKISGEPVKSMFADKDANDGTTTEVMSYSTGEGGTRVAFYVVKNGGHTWPGKRQYLPEKIVGKTSRDFDATEAIWTFFKSCPPR